MASVIGLMGNAGQANYAASKAGIIGMTKANAKELAARNITVNAIAPGFIVSPMTDKLSAETRDQYIASIPLRRFGTADDVANAVLFYASPLAAYTTGHVLNVDGGLVM
jgi:3-oxoacyl-[acyl-carrier protein] reductase